MLKSLELHGFKSFADRTRFDFAPGITCIVGPNGSGKSNVVDAIKWILGDQSPKSLRGKEMTDVIFNGSADRKPASFALATLVFDNSQHRLPIDATEVTVGRRLWRSGDSEYLLNGEATRLRDIRELFLGTGAGSAAYSIIEQGRVDRILQANSIGRREVFEEAAGIRRFKVRETEARRRLDRVEQNLLRLKDLVDEVAARLDKTRQQAGKAHEHRQLSDELRRWRVGLAADEFRQLSEKLGAANDELAAIREQAEAVSREQKDLEAQLEAANVEAAEIDDRLRQVEVQSADLRETIARHDATIRFQTGRQDEIAQELATLRRQLMLSGVQRRVLEQQCAESTRRVQQALDALNQARRAIDEHTAHRSSLETELDGMRQSVSARREQLLDRLRRRSELAAEVTSRETQLRECRSALEQLREEQSRLQERIDHTRQEESQWRERLEQAKTTADEHDRRLEHLQQQRAQLGTRMDEAQRELETYRERRGATAARLAVLDDLEQRREGLSLGVQEILSRAASSNYPPWCHILGAVADLLEVEPEYAALIDVALGPRSQLIVTTRLDELLAQLTEGHFRVDGRVGFIGLDGRSFHWSGDDSLQQTNESPTDEQTPPVASPLDSVRQTNDSADEADRTDSDAAVERAEQASDDHPGLLHRAVELVTAPEQALALVPRLLGSTFIVDTLETARELTAAGRRARFVTLQGEVLEPDGTVYLGFPRRETALISRKAEARRLRSELNRLEREQATLEQTLADVRGRLAELDSQIEATLHAQREAFERQTQCESAWQTAQEQLQQHEQLAARLAQRLRDLETTRQSAQRELEAARQRIDAFDRETQTLQNELQQQEAAYAEQQQQLRTLAEQRAVHDAEVAKLQSHLETLQSERALIVQTLNERDEQRSEMLRRIDNAVQARQEVERHLLHARSWLAELHIRKEQLAEEARRLLSLQAELRTRRNHWLDVEGKLRRQARDLAEARQQVELQVRELEHRLQVLDERLDEEYQIRLADAVADGASACRCWAESMSARRETAQPSPSTTDASQEPLAPATQVHESDAEPDVAAPDSPPAESDNPPHEPSPAEDDADDRVPVGDCAEPTTAATEAVASLDELRPKIEAHIKKLQRKLKALGTVNAESLRELEELEARHGKLFTQWSDLSEAKRALEDIIRRIHTESRRLFLQSFETIREHFRDLFRKLFGGGEADLVLEDPDDVLECGIDIVARPPGKELRSISLLSGGEKTLTAVALLLAMFRSRPSPFCILDEVDAALDEANIERYLGVLREFLDTTQFIMITHNKRSMTAADVLYGVTMEQSGVSKRLSVRFEDVSENMEFRTEERAAG